MLRLTIDFYATTKQRGKKKKKKDETQNNLAGENKILHSKYTMHC